MKVIMFGDLIELNQFAERYKSILKAEYTNLKKRTKITLIIILTALVLSITSFVIIRNIILLVISIVCGAVAFFILMNISRISKKIIMSSEDIDNEVKNSTCDRYGKRLGVLEALNSGNVVGVRFFDRNICIAAEVHIKDISDVVKTITIPNLHYKALADETLSGSIKIDINNRLLMYYFKDKDKLPFNEMLEVDTVKKENT